MTSLLSPWKAELDAIVGARHGGQTQTLLTRLRDLDTRFPEVAQINYQIAWSCDILGREREAVPYYEKSIALGLPPLEQSGALIGLGSSLRILGEYEKSVEVLESGRRLFPQHREFDIFLAMTFHHLERHAEAMQLLLLVIADSSEDPGITAYQRAVRFYAGKLSV